LATFSAVFFSDAAVAPLTAAHTILARVIRSADIDEGARGGGRGGDSTSLLVIDADTVAFAVVVLLHL
jgi:hypothetical protein